MNKNLSLEYLHELFYIDENCSLRWKIQKGRRNPGEIAGRISTHGYYEVRVDGQMYQVHRLMYMIHNSIDIIEPLRYIDHINGDRLDNSKENLRICTKGENQRNSGKQVNNTSGYKGVSWCKKDRKWVAQISHGNKIRCIGRYSTPELAYEAYCVRGRELHGEFFHG